MPVAAAHAGLQAAAAAVLQRRRGEACAKTSLARRGLGPRGDGCGAHGTCRGRAAQLRLGMGRGSGQACEG